MSSTSDPSCAVHADTTPPERRVRPRILLADDDPAIRRLVVLVLDRAGYDVASVADGGEALKHLAAHPVDLFITDLVMPEIEGIDVIMRLRRSHPQLPIIAISGGNPHVPGDFLGMARMLGAGLTLRKPFECDALLAAVREFLPGPR